MEKTRKYYSISQVVDCLGKGTISKSAIYALVKKGEIPCIRIGSKWLVAASWVEEICKNSSYGVIK